jgi:hypothetical protein
MSDKLARLAKKNDLRALCWRPRCSGLLAEIDPARFCLLFAEGTTSEGSGVHRLARHARDRIRRGKTPEYARPSQKLNDGCVVGRIRGHAISSASLPIKAACPRCGGESVLDAKTLRLTPPPPPLGPPISGGGLTLTVSDRLAWTPHRHRHRRRPTGPRPAGAAPRAGAARPGARLKR